MKKSLFLASTVLFIASCGGGSSSTTTTTETTTKKPVKSGFCSATGIVKLNGLSIKISDYDTDKNGCLNDNEVAVATKAEQAKEDAKKAKRTVSATPVIGNTNSYKVESLSVIGNRDAEVDGDGIKKAIINYNEKFTINFKTSNLPKNGKLAVIISNKKGSQIKSFSGVPGLSLTERNTTAKTLTCQYGNGSNTGSDARKPTTTNVTTLV